MTKVNIQEANSHLRQLHKKVYELENKVHMQAMYVEELEATNRKLHKATQDGTDALKEKDKLASELSKRLKESEQHVEQLLVAAQERDQVVDRLERKARLFYEVVEHRSALGHMLEVLDELSKDIGGGGSDNSEGVGDKSKNGGGGGDNSEGGCGGDENEGYN